MDEHSSSVWLNAAWGCVSFALATIGCASDRAYTISPTPSHPHASHAWTKTLKPDPDTVEQWYTSPSCVLSVLQDTRTPVIDPPDPTYSKPAFFICYAAAHGERLWTASIQRGRDILSIQSLPNALVIVKKHAVTALDHTTGETLWTLDTADRAIQRLIERSGIVYIHTRTNPPPRSKDQGTASLIALDATSGVWLRGHSLASSMNLQAIADTSQGPTLLVYQNNNPFSQRPTIEALDLRSPGASKPTQTPYPPLSPLWTQSLEPGFSQATLHNDTVTLAYRNSSVTLHTRTGRILQNDILPNDWHADPHARPGAQTPGMPSDTILTRPRRSSQPNTLNLLVTKTRTLGLVLDQHTLVGLNPSTRKPVWSWSTFAPKRSAPRLYHTHPERISVYIGHHITTLHVNTGAVLWTLDPPPDISPKPQYLDIQRNFVATLQKLPNGTRTLRVYSTRPTP